MSPSPGPALMTVILGKSFHLLSLSDNIVMPSPCEYNNPSPGKVLARLWWVAYKCVWESSENSGEICYLSSGSLETVWSRSLSSASEILLSLLHRWREVPGSGLAQRCTEGRSQLWKHTANSFLLTCTLWCCPYIHLLLLQGALRMRTARNEKESFWWPVAGFCVTCLKNPKIFVAFLGNQICSRW